MKLHKWSDIKHKNMTPERIAASEKWVKEELAKIYTQHRKERAWICSVWFLFVLIACAALIGGLCIL